MTVTELKAAAVAKEVAKTGEFTALEGERPFLDFLKEIFNKLLPALLGCFGVVGAAKELKSPGFFTRRKLRVTIKEELRGHPQFASLSTAVESAVLKVGAKITEAEVKTMSEELNNEASIEV